MLAKTEHPTILTANTRLARVLRRDYDLAQIAGGNAVWEPPDVLPLGAWLERCWRDWLYSGRSSSPAQLLSAAQEQAIWEDIIKSLERDADLLQLTATAESAQEAWTLLHSWQLSPDAAEWADTRETEAFRRWALEFRRRCESRNWLSAALLPDFIAQRIEAGEVSVPGRIVLCGFLERTPSLQKLIEVLESAGSRVELRGGRTADQRDTASRIEFRDREEEFRKAAQWARRLIEDSHDRARPAPRIGIVVPELSAARSTIERVFAEEFHPNGRLSPDRDSRRAFNTSLGPNLPEYPLIQSALLILNSRPAGMPLEEASRIVRSPFIAGAEEEAACRGVLDACLRKRGEPVVGIGDIRSLAASHSDSCACPKLVEGLRHWHEAGAAFFSRQTPREWATTFSSQLRAIGWPGDRPLHSAEHQTFVAWNELLGEFASLDAVTGSLTAGEALATLERLGSSKAFQPESEPAPVQILGILEAAGMEFDSLWITGMHDGLWPASPEPNPFLPLRLQRTHKLPHASPQRELEFARRATTQMLGSSSTVVVSSPRQEGDTDLRPSPLFAALPETSAEQLRLAPRTGHAELLRLSSRIETVVDNDAPPFHGNVLRGGTAIFKHQAACPFRAFVQVRLGAEPLEAAHPGLSAADRGNLVHDIFHRIWNVLGSHARLMEADSRYLTRLIRDEVRSALEDRAEERRVLKHTRFAAIEQARLEKLAAEWLELEKRRQAFVVVEQEQEKRVVVGGIEFKTRADRIDRLEDGTHVVLDYKTADPKVSGWTGPRPDEPQVPLYAITADVRVSGVLFGIARPGQIGFRGLTQTEAIVPKPKSRSSDPSLEELIEQWRRVMTALAEDFRAGKAVVDPKDPQKSCHYCGLHAVCRIREAKIVEMERRA